MKYPRVLFLRFLRNQLLNSHTILPQKQFYSGLSTAAVGRRFVSLLESYFQMMNSVPKNRWNLQRARAMFRRSLAPNRSLVRH